MWHIAWFFLAKVSKLSFSGGQDCLIFAWKTVHAAWEKPAVREPWKNYRKLSVWLKSRRTILDNWERISEAARLNYMEATPAVRAAFFVYAVLWKLQAPFWKCWRRGDFNSTVLSAARPLEIFQGPCPRFDKNLFFHPHILLPA
jgi:hypothetical protein